MDEHLIHLFIVPHGVIAALDNVIASGIFPRNKLGSIKKCLTAILSYFWTNDKMFPVFIFHADAFSFQLTFYCEAGKTNLWHPKILRADSDATESDCHVSFCFALLALTKENMSCYAPLKCAFAFNKLMAGVLHIPSSNVFVFSLSALLKDLIFH